jgi:ankyrin repeat protein
MMAIDKPLNLEAVLRAGANLNQRDRYGNTAFKLAKQNSRLRAIEILRASGADVD